MFLKYDYFTVYRIGEHAQMDSGEKIMLDTRVKMHKL